MTAKAARERISDVPRKIEQGTDLIDLRQLLEWIFCYIFKLGQSFISVIADRAIIPLFER